MTIQNFIACIFVCIKMCIHVCAYPNVCQWYICDVRGQTVGFGSPHTICGSQEANSASPADRKHLCLKSHQADLLLPK